MTADEAVDAGPETRIVVRRTVPAPAAEVFALLSDPARHAEIDGSGMVRAAQDGHPVAAVGDVFTMHMHREGRAEPDYTTDNHVLRLKPNRRIAWATCLPGAEPSGFYWEFELQSEDELTTEVVHTYDWSEVTDPAVLARITFPLVSADQMQATLDQLAAALG